MATESIFTGKNLRFLLLSLALIAALAVLNLLTDGESPEGSRTLGLIGLVVFWALPLLAFTQRQRITKLWRDLGSMAQRDAAPLPRHPVLNLVLVSFVVLFVETMLIRYIGSQTRIFAFYKNIPLIGAFLGLGVGCYLGKGGRREALLFLAAVAVIGLFFSTAAQSLGVILGLSASSASSEQVFGYSLARVPDFMAKLIGNVHVGLFCVAVFLSLAGCFSLLGRILATSFDGLPRLKAYTANIAGSLAGLVAFVLLSRLMTPPWIWFLVGLAPMLWWLGRGRTLKAGAALIVVAAAVVAPHLHDTVWSTYQKLVGKPIANGYEIYISDAFYQRAYDLRPEAVAKFATNPMPTYDAEFKGIEKLDRVLVVGAGSGNDVAAALRAGAGHVDAVDIDAAIVEMGRLHHPEHPYDDPRVTPIIDDARDA
ncbi:MAG TPA: hypothetical protein VMT54_22600, partial [Candidatus Cybelea sp.]|nr:hypothetical protein [Candidatus Cybelea sp.]